MGWGAVNTGDKVIYENSMDLMCGWDWQGAWGTLGWEVHMGVTDVLQA